MKDFNGIEKLVGIPKDSISKELKPCWVYLKLGSWGDAYHHHYAVSIPKDGHEYKYDEWMKEKYGIDPDDYIWSANGTPYNPCHNAISNCCGIFTHFDGETLYCNECGISINDFFEDVMHETNIVDRFSAMCAHSLPPDVFEQFLAVKKVLVETRKKLKKSLNNGE